MALRPGKSIPPGRLVDFPKLGRVVLVRDVIMPLCWTRHGPVVRDAHYARMHIIKLVRQPTGCITEREGLPAFSFLADVMMSLPFKRKGIIEVEVPYIFFTSFS